MEQRFPERFGRVFADSLTRLATFSKGRITLCLENTHLLATPFLQQISRQASENGLGLVWDAAHAELLPAGKRELAIKFLEDNMRFVKLAHLHDIRDNADHKELGAGRLDIVSYLRIFNELNLDIILEILPEDSLLRSVAYLKSLSPAAQ